ncbi:hypothetical protein, partial [Klebsiella pneumoniae]|uniref:hypothetical protein n=1 Tax=Klebsiella pneumoniae TaxID=573 RepID=UPI0027305677
IQGGLRAFNWFTGHNPLTKMGTSFMHQDGDYAMFFIDKGMSPKFGGEGSYALIGAGVRFRGFSAVRSRAVVDSPVKVTEPRGVIV